MIGSFQSLKNEVDPVNAEKYGFTVVRRISGGGAMFMEAGSVITYSIYAPTELVQGMSFADSYAFLDEWVITALKSLGIDAHYQPLNDITSPTGKIGGAAQKRLGSGAVLHHVTMSYDMDGDKMVQVLRIGREKLSDKGITSAAKRVDPLRSQTGLSRAEIIDRMKQTFTEPVRGHAGRDHRRGVRQGRRPRREQVQHRRVDRPRALTEGRYLPRRSRSWYSACWSIQSATNGQAATTVRSVRVRTSSSASSTRMLASPWARLAGSTSVWVKVRSWPTSR